MSIRFLCPPYPDEHLYSIAARTKWITTATSSRLLARDLAGSCSLRLDLGVGFDLAQREYGDDEGTYSQTTLAKFFSSFLSSPQQRTELQTAIRQGEKPQVAYLLGRMGARRLYGNYKFCPRCAKEQRDAVGEAYWTRLPQISGFTHCPDHGCAYFDSEIGRTGRNFIRLDALSNVSLTNDCSENQVLIDLCREGRKLLDFESNWDTESIDRAWRALLQPGDLKPGTHGAAGKLCGLLKDRYGSQYLLDSGCGLEGRIEHSWAAKFLRAPANETDPLRHLLVLRLLGAGIEDLTLQCRGVMSGQSLDPVRCINPICPEIGGAMIGQSGSSFDRRKTDSRRVRSTCTRCHQTIEQSLDPGSRSGARIVQRGSLWEKELTNLWHDTGTSVRQIGVRLGADSMTIKRHAQRLGLPFPRRGSRISRQPSSGPKIRKRDDSQALSTHRRQWSSALAKAKTTTSARKLAGGSYAWLYRHDWEWLKQSLPARVKVVGRHSRVDWAERDAQFVNQFDLAVKKIMACDPPMLCSMTALLRELGAYRFMCSLERMPRLQELLGRSGEDRIAYAIRRINRARQKAGARLSPRELFVTAKLKSDLWQNQAVRAYLGL